jgi:glycosyltransferase involved in cell wall biosynthesis
MTAFKKVVRFMINRQDGAGQYDFEIDNALSDQVDKFYYEVKDIKDYKSLPRILCLIIFWLRAQYILFFGKVDIAIVSPWMLLIYPKRVSIICISHHYDPSVFGGIRKIYIKLSHWLFILQRSQVEAVVSCSEYWSNYYKKKGFKNAVTIFNGFDIKSMDQSLDVPDSSFVLERFGLISKKYLHLGSYGPAKGQNIAFKYLKDLGLPMIATSASKEVMIEDLQDIIFIKANFNEYNILLKNAKATICMSEFKEGWCRVLHEAAIHGTPIIGSGLGGMKELLEIGNFTSSTGDKLRDDFNNRTKEESLPKIKMSLYRTFTLEKFYEAWRFCVLELLDA